MIEQVVVYVISIFFSLFLLQWVFPNSVKDLLGWKVSVLEGLENDSLLVHVENYNDWIFNEEELPDQNRRRTLVSPSWSGLKSHWD